MPPSPTWIDWVAPDAVAAFAVLALAWIWGAVLGSFVNVVVHRLPLGQSPFAGRSRCPRCRQAIRARDNLPVLGWLLLGGRCRSCGGLISPRYPCVEAACGFLCCAAAFPALAHAPVPSRHAGGEWPAAVAWTADSLVLLSLVTWSLLENRGGPECPGAGIAIAAVVAAATIVPRAGPPGLLASGAAWPAATPAAAHVITVLVGLATGRLGGRWTRTATGRWGMPLLGAAAGWQAVLITSAVTTLAGASVRLRIQRDDRGGRRRRVAVVNAILTIGAAVALGLGKPVLQAASVRLTGN